MVLTNIITKGYSITFAIFHWLDVSYRVSPTLNKGHEYTEVGITEGTFRVCPSQPQKFLFYLFYILMECGGVMYLDADKDTEQHLQELKTSVLLSFCYSFF